MGFSAAKFQTLSPTAQAKKCADLLRILILRLGGDWRRVPAEYNQLMQWMGQPQYSVNPQHLQLNVLRDFYNHWREQAQLGPEKDVALGTEDPDREIPLSPPLAWDVLAHNLRSAHNVGAILRTIDCLGWRQLHTSGYTAPVEHKALRSAARGAETWIPVQNWESPLDSIAAAKRAGQAVIALELTPDAQEIDAFTWPTSGLLVLGNEELGVPPEILAQCDQTIYIPMYGRKNSLNVALAFAICANSARQKLC